MFTFLKKKPKGQAVTFKIAGMHCTSCAMNIDGALEETPGVYSSFTSYAQSKVSVEYDPQQLTLNDLKQVITDQGYKVL